MYTHVTLGTNDLAKGRDFYDAVLATLGITRFREIENAACFWRSESGQMFILCRPRDGNPATVGNGVTIGFAAPSRAAVHAFHEAGLKAGGTDEGAPGPRDFAPNAYAAYLRDPDGNKITALCMAAE
ncbi:MAG: VOC family protein [Alphaproteobacteria bacterium]|nr:MAG: VOC family protein [Alphaproteobacteria bacterium]